MSNPILRIQLLRKLWVHLTPREMFGISPPDKIQRSGRPLGDVRRKELTHLLQIEKQLHELRRDSSSQQVAFSSGDKESTTDVAYSQFIDFQQADAEKVMQLPEIGKMLSNADDLSRYESLERLLRLQKLYLLTERIILGIELNEIDKGPLDRRWFNRWKLNACEISNGPLQQLWARILVRELRNSGSCSLKALGYLSGFSIEDAGNLNRLASWTLGDFVYRSALQALSGHFDSELFEKLEEHGIVRGVFGKVLSKALRSDSDQGFHASLIIADKRLSITSVQPRTELHVPAYMLTSVGRELLALVAPAVDQDYLNLVVQDLHARGMSVDVVENDADPSALQVC
ncbi:hypothetical protein A9Q81_11535 [Gammaproteobacteria bacterium 42_54_T18]|nr:hypothetical protein A9Q81_11535 [Gammaproteobacteria bacterium 42_54_T18]